MTHPDLPFEQAKNREYLDKLEKKLQRNPLRGVARNVIWIDQAEHQKNAATYRHPLLGRVGCESDEPDLRDFYIGPRFIDDGDILVYSWAAPVAECFFRPESEAARSVVVRRTFSHKNDDVIDVDDEWAGKRTESPFVSKELQVPAPAPSKSSRRRVAPATPPVSEQDGSGSAAEQGVAPVSDPSSAKPVVKNELPHKQEDIRAGMRARDTVLKRLAAPREDRLLSVLALLQPDQHAMTSWPVDQNLVIQGHPGTGKTVVAAYRAAYLVNPTLYENGGVLASRAANPLRVLVVGPTAGYVDHVKGLIEVLDSVVPVTVTSITELLMETTGMKGQWGGGLAGEYDDVDARAEHLTHLAASILRGRASRHQVQVRSQVFGNRPAKARQEDRDQVKGVYELLRSNGTGTHSLSQDPEEVRWMKSLPPFESVMQRRYLPLMAQCRLAVKRLSTRECYDHVIVDEAQDVSPIEWTVLSQFLSRDGCWTLIGDMNQRRSDVTYGSWHQIVGQLGLDNGGDFQVQVMTRGYRSTGRILRLADRLLPAKQRGNQTIQDEGEPILERRVTKVGDLIPAAVETAALLARKYRSGSAAIISVSPHDIITELGRRGWRRPKDSQQVWRKDDLVLRLHVPESARGLEFDAAVVVEPAEFPANLGRTGPLYTSLTRANKELAIVWHRALPDGLRRGLRR